MIDPRGWIKWVLNWLSLGIKDTAAMFPPANNSLVTPTGQRLDDYTTLVPGLSQTQTTFHHKPRSTQFYIYFLHHACAVLIA